MGQIIARYASTCPKCLKWITVGTKVEWSKGTKATHVACPSAEVAAATPSGAAPHEKIEPSKMEAPFVAYENWPPCRRASLANATGETRRYTSGTRGGAHPRDGHGQATIAPGGVYVVVAQQARFWTEEDTDDMGETGAGAHWAITLYLREVTSEEADRDANQRLGAVIPAIGAAIANHISRAAKAAADTLIRASEAHVEFWSLPDLRSSTEEVILWSDHKGSYRSRINFHTTTLDGETQNNSVYASYNYVYDWDQPIIINGTKEATTLFEIGVACTLAAEKLQAMMRRSQKQRTAHTEAINEAQ